MIAKRNYTIEKELQDCLNGGHNLWAIGDVHGYAETLNQLINRLNLQSEDRVVLLGDMVDRGPKSNEVIKIVRNDPRFFSILGNHEQMMLENLDPLNVDCATINNMAWLQVGGRATIKSYIHEFTNTKGQINYYRLKKSTARDLAWLDSLPHHIVIDEFRLVHAGYCPQIRDPDLQTRDTLLWIRSGFHNSSFPIDNDRTVIFGHSPMPMFGLSQTEVWESDAELPNGRAAAIGIDSCCYGGNDPQLTAINLQTGEIIKQKRRD